MKNYNSSQDILKKQIQDKYIKEENVILSNLEEKTEKLYDSVFFIGRIRDIKLSKYNEKIDLIEADFLKSKNKLKFNLGVQKISKQEYDQKISNLENEFNTVKKEKEKILIDKKEKYKEKIENLIKEKSLANKEKIKELTLISEKKIEELKKYFSELEEKVIEKNIDKLAIIDEKKNTSLESKVQNYNKTKQLEILETQKENGLIDEDFYKVSKNKLSNQISTKREKIISKNTIFDLANYRIQIKMAKMFGYQTRKNVGNGLLNLLSKSKLIIIIMIFCVIVGFQNPFFFTQATWVNIIAQNVDLGCLALGMTIIILTGGIDLSVGSTMAIGGSIIAKFAINGTNMWISVVVTIIFSMFIGMISGLFVGYVKLQPFIITLVLMIGLRGFAYIYLENKTIILSDSALSILVSQKLFNLPIAVFVFFGLALVSYIIMRFYKYGRYIYSVGGNINAARLSGIKTREVLMSSYIFAGFCVSIGTILYMARTNIITPTTGNQWELNAICAVALGGTALTGGRGGIFQTLIGWLVLSILTTALIMVGISPNYQLVIKACVILLAVLSDKNINIVQKTKQYINQIRYSI
ncbi:ribose transport system permease protein [Spiroplasma chinense]|uniref:Ribose transport system permease protein n=1 Tax=Spiroplasma chinense TaxID=216932 RepID=A0A5B9Y4G7_9MOLU|nr:hypothetical protein [Spiroplasma chinense]QEH61850.1 ribose transport system permease protein [Spiroplasma chinense]